VGQRNRHFWFRRRSKWRHRLVKKLETPHLTGIRSNLRDHCIDIGVLHRVSCGQPEMHRSLAPKDQSIVVTPTNTLVWIDTFV
jgi:hypothetical protein